MAEAGGVDPHPFRDSLFSRQVSGPPLIQPLFSKYVFKCLLDYIEMETSSIWYLDIINTDSTIMTCIDDISDALSTEL